MSHDRTVIRHAVEEIDFGLFTDEDIRRLSVKRITSPVTFDTLNNPLPGGLYDPVLGPTEKMMMCETCGQDQKNCPGHLGHIELAVSVYNPLLFGALYKLMRAKCFNCHNFRLSKSKTRIAAVKPVGKEEFVEVLTSYLLREPGQMVSHRIPLHHELLMMLVDAGRVQEALKLDEELLGYLRDDDMQKRDVIEGNSADTLVCATRFRDRVLDGLERELTCGGRADWCGGHHRTLRRQLVETLLKALGACKRCENCGAFSPNIRKNGSDKLFQMPLSEKLRQANQSCNTDITSAVQRFDPGTGDVDPTGDDSDPMSEDDSESEGDGDDVDGNGTVSGVPPAAAAATGAAAGSRSGPVQKSKFMPPIEVELQMQYLWKQEARALELVFTSGRPANEQGLVEDGFRMFFVRALAVPPPRFRPPMNMGDFIAEHPQNVYLTKILTLNERLKNAESLKGDDLASTLSTWIELQTTVNCYIDSSKDPRGLKDTPPGLRQVLEKKEGLFRKHMMGKRVNYACRSVISPDPYIGTTEIGIPLRFARELTYPQPVADWNVESMRELVENGAKVYPGANFVEDPSGRLLHLDRLTDLKRRAVAARLLSIPGQKVWRHLQDGDCMLVNRQPTLHKPGIMAHSVRVLRNPGYQTIRMHYANCNTYNADFDGDEINCHLPQNEVARAEASLLAFTDEQYLVPTNGKPLRGLIQDHVDAGVKMCSKDCFFTRGQYQQLVYQALAGLPGLEIVPPSGRIYTLPPAIIKPVQRWTGKQVISTILKHLTNGLPQLNLDSKTKTPAVAFGDSEREHQVMFREGELLRGVLDKGAFGSTEFGFVHAVHELYGATSAGKLLTALGRVLTIFLQSAGHTCGIEDLTLTARAEGERRAIIHKSLGVGQRSMRELLTVQDGGSTDANTTVDRPEANGGGDGDVIDEPLEVDEVHGIRQRTAAFLLGEGRDERLADIDRHMQSALAPVSSSIIKACLPRGQEKPFPHNSFSLMVLTGAKGSMVNHSQVSCALGQQALEGRRVPVMVSGKSLPSFQAFEPSPRANGFITDRFLTGIRPQEYYFHCMAGREGLVDTAVKTSRSGYLQRCLVKHLEELKVGYDNTVRDGEGCVQQFFYGEDGVDTTQTKYLSSGQLGFLSQNHEAVRHKYGITDSFEEDNGFDRRRATRAHAAVFAAKRRSGEATAADGEGVHLVPGESILARRRVQASGAESWDEGNLLEGWHPAKVTKARTSGVSGPVYNIRYKDDGAIAKEVPLMVDSSPSCLPDGDEGGGEIGGRSARRRLLKRDGTAQVADPVLSTLNVNKDLGCTSEAFQSSLQAFLASDPTHLRPKAGASESSRSLREAFELSMWVKYMKCLAAPGETVGSLAAQSVGEPSTQMTLNTFHLAGHGGANVTLGIPRLREIIMTAAKNLKTPSTVVPLRDGTPRAQGDSLALKLSRLSLSKLLHNKEGIVVRERLVKGDTGLWERHYAVCLKLFPSKLIRHAFGIDFRQVCRSISGIFLPHLLSGITADLRRSGERLSGARSGPSTRGSTQVSAAGDVQGDESSSAVEALKSSMKRARKADAEYESDDEDEEQGTLTFGKQKEQASYAAMDDDEKAIWKAMSQKDDGGLLDALDEDDAPHLQSFNGDDEIVKDRNGKFMSDGVAAGIGENDKDFFAVPHSVANSRNFKSIAKNKKTGEVEVTVKLPSSTRRLLMVGLAEAAAEKAMVRSHVGIKGAFVVETASGGKTGVAVQLEGSCFETIWQLREGGPDGFLDLNKLTSNDIWSVCQTYGVEAARASIVAEITGVFGAYGIAVDPRHLGLVADHMTFDGGYRPMNRAGMADFSSPCLQMSFETTAEFLAKAAVAGKGDRLKSPSSRIVVGRVGSFGTGMFDLRQPAAIVVGGVSVN